MPSPRWRRVRASELHPGLHPALEFPERLARVLRTGEAPFRRRDQLRHARNAELLQCGRALRSDGPFILETRGQVRCRFRSTTAAERAGGLCPDVDICIAERPQREIVRTVVETDVANGRERRRTDL